jgi:sugar-specific transcriptional regulator TrmB
MSEISNSYVIERLEELGFTHHEALVYLATLKNGEASAGVILDEVKLHREQVYRALKKLVDDGLLTTYEKRKRSYYSAVDPEVILNQTKERVAIAESVEPYLKSLHQAKPQVIKVWEGEDSIKYPLEDILQTLKPGEEYLVLGAVGQEFYEAVRKYGDYYSKRFNKKDIKGRIIYFEGEGPQQTPGYGESVSVKRLKRPALSPVSTVIYGNKVALEWTKPGNSAVISIENEELAESYRQTFEALWK